MLLNLPKHLKEQAEKERKERLKPKTLSFEEAKKQVEKHLRQAKKRKQHET